MQTPLLFRHIEAAVLSRAPEKREAVYTKLWITGLILDMADYDVAGNLAAKFAVEPVVGEGAFLAPDDKGRADLYVAFFEAALCQLSEGGVCACCD